MGVIYLVIEEVLFVFKRLRAADILEQEVRERGSNDVPVT